MSGPVEAKTVDGVEKGLLVEYDCFTRQIFPRYRYDQPLDLARFLVDHKIEMVRSGANFSVRLYGNGTVEGRTYGECASLAQLVVLDPDFLNWHRRLGQRQEMVVYVVSGHCDRYFKGEFCNHTWIEVYYPDFGREIVVDPAFRTVLVSDRKEYQWDPMRAFVVVPGQTFLRAFTDHEILGCEFDHEGVMITPVPHCSSILGLIEDGRPLSFAFYGNRETGKVVTAVCFGQADGNSEPFYINEKTGKVMNIFGEREPSELEQRLTREVVWEFERAGINGRRPDTMIS